VATGDMEPCDAWMRHKAKAKGVSRKPLATCATKAREQLFLETSGPYELSAGGKNNNVHVVDQPPAYGYEMGRARCAMKRRS
jgi:hypothetical protein